MWRFVLFANVLTIFVGDCVHIPNSESHSCGHGTSSTFQPLTHQDPSVYTSQGDLHERDRVKGERGMHAQATSFRKINIRLNLTFVNNPAADVSKSLQTNKTCTSVGQKLVVSKVSGSIDSIKEACMDGDVVKNIDTCYVVCREKDLAYQYSGLLQKEMESVLNFYSSWLEVEQLDAFPEIFTDQDCGDLPLTNESLAEDLVVYVTMRPMPYLPTTLAFANPCFLHHKTSRPIAMHVNVQPETLASNSDMGTVLRHELMHGLGFSPDMYRFYRHPSDRSKTYYEYSKEQYPTGPLRSSKPAAIVMNDDNGRFGPGLVTTELGPGSTLRLVTPTVVEFARNYFNCPSLDGVELENDGQSASAGTHWESRILYWELMTALQKSAPGKLTGFTTALMKDMGFYDVARSFVPDTMDFGLNRGCEFVGEKCNFLKLDTRHSWYFCDNSTEDNCGYNQQFVGRCNVVDYASDDVVPQPYRYFDDPRRSGTDVYIDRCPIVEAYNDGWCTKRPVSTSAGSLYMDANGSSTRCYRTDVILNGYTLNGFVVARCFKTVCLGLATSMVRLGEFVFDCTSELRPVTFIGPASVDAAPAAGRFIRNGLARGTFRCTDPTFLCDPDAQGVNGDLVRVSMTWPSITDVLPSTNVTLEGGAEVFLVGDNMSKCTGVRVGEADGVEFEVLNKTHARFLTPEFSVSTGGSGANGLGWVQIQLRCHVPGCDDADTVAKGGCIVGYAEIEIEETNDQGWSAAEELSGFFGTVGGFVVLAVIGLLVVLVGGVLVKSLFCGKPQRFDNNEDEEIYNINGDGRTKPLHQEEMHAL